jgi:DNA polymerase-3 subunit alpha
VNNYLTNLHVVSVYSFLRSVIDLPKYLEFAKQHQLITLSFVGENSLYGAYDFYQACEKANINPIIGLTMTCQIKNNHLKITLFAKNKEGYCQLLKLSSELMQKTIPTIVVADD